MPPEEALSPAREQEELERWWKQRFERPASGQAVPLTVALSGAAFGTTCAVCALLAPLHVGAGPLLAVGLSQAAGVLLSPRLRQAARALRALPLSGTLVLLAWVLLLPAGRGWELEGLLFGLLGCASATLVVSALLPRAEPDAGAASSDSAEAAREALAQPGGPDLVALLFAAEQPHGGRTLARLDLWREPARGRVTAQVLPYAAPWGPRSGAMELSAEEAERLLQRASVEALERLVPPGKHRLPCVLQVLRREGPDLHGALDLSALSEAERSQPTARLIQAVLEAAQRAAPGSGAPGWRSRARLLAWWR